MADRIDIILIGGQSNAVGCTDKYTLDEQYRDDVYENVRLYQEGNFSPDAMGKILRGIRWGMGNNPDQMGIEYGLSSELNNSDPPVGLIRFAYGGTDLTFHWSEPLVAGPASVEEKGYCRYAFIETVRHGMQAYREAGFDPVIRGMVWMQGESDTNKTEAEAEQYEDNLRDLFRYIRTELQLPKLKILVGGISTAPPLAPFSDLVRDKQKRYCESDEFSLFVNNSDIPIGSDGWHYNGNEDLKLGKRFGRYVKNFLIGRE